MRPPLADTPPQIPLNEFVRVGYGEWWKMVDMEEARTEYAHNVEAVQQALIYHDMPDRPINILCIHGSSRSNPDTSCAHELSNSQLLLRRGLKALESMDDVEMEEVALRDYKIEYCNNCYSTCSALCNFPCTCFPFDPMQDLYPKVLRCDVMLMSTGVNQSAMSSRLKAFCDRLISLDGGYYVHPKDLRSKDEDYKNHMIATSLNQPVHYDQRLHGRVAAFFISSKDDADDLPAGDHRDEMPSYTTGVADSLYRGFADFGFFMADPWWTHFHAVVDEEMSYDKMRLQLDTDVHTQAERLVAAAVELARQFRVQPPPRGPHPPNRT